jgi:hypothetical protein
VDDPVAVVVPCALPVEVLDGAGWIEGVVLGWVLAVESLGGWPGWVALPLVELELGDSAGVLVDVLSVWITVLSAGPLGVAPPPPLTGEMPPLDFSWSVTGPIVVTGVDDAVCVVGGVDALAGSLATGAADGREGGTITGGGTAGASTLSVLTAADRAA